MFALGLKPVLSWAGQLASGQTMPALTLVLLIAATVGFVVLVRFLMAQSEARRRVTLADGSTFIPVSRGTNGFTGFVYGDAGGHNCSGSGGSAGDAGSCGGHHR